MTGAELIAAERERQVKEEGWTAEHDAEHAECELTDAAITYARAGTCVSIGIPVENLIERPPVSWPESWDLKHWKPSADPVRNLVKAGALIAAEIDRLQAKG